MNAVEIIWWLHLIATAGMAGIIWFVQLVHYPLFHYVGKNEYERHHTQHMTRTGLLIAPLMLTEMGTGLMLLLESVLAPGSVFSHPSLFNASMLLLGLIWLSTFLVQVRYHRELDKGRDESAIHDLIRTNWVRTVLWTLRLPLLVIALCGSF